MKKSLALILAGGLALGSLKLFSQNLEIPYETDPYKFIPQGAVALKVTVKTDNGFLRGFWYEENLHSLEDYLTELTKTDWIIPIDKFFLDLNGDDILDLSLEDLEGYIQLDNLAKTSS